MAESRLERFRERKNELFAGDEQSPLDPDQQARFEALDYFPENDDLSLTLPLDTEEAGTELIVDTSDCDKRTYIRAGKITVPIGDQEITLTLLGQPGQHRLFLPFQDATSGIETYSGGRYLEPRLRPDGQVEVDFNYAYNPYCAYGDGWSCPIPPNENIVPVRIEAGEKAFVLKDADES
jgi:uncharacterized protein